ncbi:hypothetical protein SERLA73DRAFT_184955 [Serpula lacrymans var. lacrymans S7.3]|uniref:Uncharacterized protein n=2 Tax=Serpula lacrymans var. lacrymans TaxID=341189 RepID=F8Q3T9_SERL3|nr:uncharacterized protein SERLADRAFT_473144 [Serpula lacrymans var. lacrymans S7.9]EGN96795.1 hypothetical protein SERLA73DRAFT_184955 [Serpula lacrymans var. lacrymans S7.3]EGO22394.1 hypothetical protein SERLADRAFT_473144 [Serpula lacrymans var. lacrymans S7.9]
MLKSDKGLSLGWDFRCVYVIAPLKKTSATILGNQLDVVTASQLTTQITKQSNDEDA